MGKHKKREKNVNIFAGLIDAQEYKEYIYKKIDKSLTLSFIGGVSLGLGAFFSIVGYNFIALVVIVLSLVIFFASRFNGLRFIFEGDEEE